MTGSHHIRSALIGLAFCMTCLAGPLSAWGQGTFAGVYTGTYFSACDPDDGEFAILVEVDNTALALTYDPLDGEGNAIDGIAINAGGSFTHSHFNGLFTTDITGSFTASGVSGTYTVTDLVGNVCTDGSFSGSKLPNSGFLAGAGGYYKGSENGVISLSGALIDTGTVVGDAFAILSANGESFVFIDALFKLNTFGNIPGQDGGLFTVQTNGSISQMLLGGLDIDGSVNSSAKTAQGTFALTETVLGVIISTSGTWTLARVSPLPDTNMAPVAADDAYSTKANRSLVVAAADGVLANDSDPDGDPLSAALVDNAADGSVALDADGGFTYTPDKGFSGTDGFSYRASDGSKVSGLASVAIDVERLLAMPGVNLLLLGK